MNMNQPAPDYSAIKTRQQAAWASGDYAIVGTTLQIVGEQLCETMNLKPGSKVLDVAAGNGNATLAAARRFADVTSTDYVETLLDKGRARAAAEHLPVTFAVADAEALPYADNSFDFVLSTFGVMFAPDHETAAAEMLRVCRKGGRIGLANWTPEGFIGQVFKTLGKHVPPAPGLRSPALWGSREHLGGLFAGNKVEITPRTFNFRYRSAAHFMDIFRTYYGPVHKAFLSLDETKQAALEADLLALIKSLDVATDGTMLVPSTYVEAVIHKA
jgi:ubiquinone/menaquinone biosynthesis C-methylase UbiE